MILNFKDEYSVPFTVSDEVVLEQLKEHLMLKVEGSLTDYILDFCERNSYRIEEVAEIIKNDKVLKGIIKQDCIFHGIFENPNKIEDW